MERNKSGAERSGVGKGEGKEGRNGLDYSLDVYCKRGQVYIYLYICIICICIIHIYVCE